MCRVLWEMSEVSCSEFFACGGEHLLVCTHLIGTAIVTEAKFYIPPSYEKHIHHIELHTIRTNFCSHTVDVPNKILI